MRGIITNKARNGSKWIIVKGEDGIKYFIGCMSFVNPKQYKRYAYKGNLVVFDKDTSQEWDLPHGCNATLAEIIDPHKEERRIRAIEHEERRLANEERKRQAKERNELLKARADQRRAYEAANTWYEIQYYRAGEGWKPVYYKGLPVKCNGFDNAERRLEEIRRIDPFSTKYRCVKSIGLAVTV